MWWGGFFDAVVDKVSVLVGLVVRYIRDVVFTSERKGAEIGESREKLTHLLLEPYWPTYSAEKAPSASPHAHIYSASPPASGSFHPSTPHNPLVRHTKQRRASRART